MKQYKFLGIYSGCLRSKYYGWISSSQAKEIIMDTIKNKLSEIDRNYFSNFCILKMLPKTCLLSSVGDTCIILISCLTLSSNRIEYTSNNTWNGNVHVFSMIYIFLWYSYTVFSCVLQGLTTCVLRTQDSFLSLTCTRWTRECRRPVEKKIHQNYCSGLVSFWNVNLTLQCKMLCT